MMAVALPAEEFERRARELGGRGHGRGGQRRRPRWSCPAIPRRSTSSGAPARPTACGRGRIAVSYAGHSPQVEAAARGAARRRSPGSSRAPSEVPLYSTVTGGPAATETMDAEHWYRNLRQTVQFEPAVRAMAQAGHRHADRGRPPSGPAPPGARDARVGARRARATVAAIASLRRDEGGPERFLASLAEAHVRGVRVDWEPLFAGAGRVDLPDATPSSASATGCRPAPALRTRRRSARRGPSTRCSARWCRSQAARARSSPAGCRSSCSRGSRITPCWARWSCRARRSSSWRCTRRRRPMRRWSRS